MSVIVWIFPCHPMRYRTGWQLNGKMGKKNVNQKALANLHAPPLLAIKIPFWRVHKLIDKRLSMDGLMANGAGVPVNAEAIATNESLDVFVNGCGH
ncbi:MAG: hypothetical protein VW907_05875 [Opitutae bacterium]